MPLTELFSIQQFHLENRRKAFQPFFTIVFPFVLTRSYTSTTSENGEARDRCSQHTTKYTLVQILGNSFAAHSNVNMTAKYKLKKQQISLSMLLALGVFLCKIQLNLFLESSS